MARAAWIKIIEDSESTGKARRAYEQVAADWGSNFNMARVAPLWPELLKMQEEEFELFSGPGTKLGSDIKDLIAAHVSQLNNCGYCDHWYREALKLRGWSDERITHVLQDIQSEHLDQAGRAIMKFADKITRRPQAIDGGDIDELRRAGIDDRAILEAAALTGYFNYMTRLANTLAVMTGPDRT